MRQLCPSCDGYFDPVDGPCSNVDGGVACGYQAPPATPPKPRPIETEGQVAKVDRAALGSITDERLEGHRRGLAAARRALAEADFRRRKANDPDFARVLGDRPVESVNTGGRL